MQCVFSGLTGHYREVVLLHVDTFHCDAYLHFYYQMCYHCYRLKARVVNLPGMEDEPSTTFEDFTALMEKLGLGSREEQDGEEEIEEIKRQDETEKKVTWREHDSDALRQELTKKDREQHDTPPPAVRGTWKDERSKVTPDVGKIIMT